ncbi:MAG: flavodoxin-dependent (E)-4-hydroxy-3-methylbut-2-enyl-diphosphate synthase, partial [Clostridia bacterium]|nr:flavodoxin-dependent (E)-4-hydroxy-3-methylbut-2-enyl-diphosphate synthase [Clostridia bacterium]
PTCGRCQWDVILLAQKVNGWVEHINKPLKIAVMGCVVNGPGEAKDCDLGIAGAADYCVIFKGGQLIRRISVSEAEREFRAEIDKLIYD